MGSCQCHCNCLKDKKNEENIEIEHLQAVEELPSNPPARKSLDIEPEARISDFCIERTSGEIQTQSLFRSYLVRKDFETLSTPILVTEELEESEHNSLEVVEENSDNSLSIKSSSVHSAEEEPGKPALVELDEVPPNILSDEAKGKHDLLGAYEFVVNTLPGSLWKGPTRLADGSVYVGEWNEDGEPEGNGTMYYIEGGICEGQWKNGKLNGDGRRISPLGDVYTGQWIDGQKTGKGRLEFDSQGSLYDGEWFEDMQHGYGEESWTDGSSFKGHYAMGHKQGKGLFMWADGSSYEGDFVENRLEGYGVYKWNQGKEYAGDWKDSKMHGKGFFKWDDGRSYNGEYVNDQKEGWGVFVWPNGKRYEGMWKNGKQDGDGMMYNEKGKGRKGVWENGKQKRK